MGWEETRWREGFYEISWWTFLLVVFIIPLPLPSWVNSLLLVWLSLYLLVRMAFKEFKLDRGIIALLAFLAIVLVSCLFSINLNKSMTYFRKDMVLVAILYLSASQMVTTRKRLIQLSLVLLLSFMVAVVLSFGHYGKRHALYGIFGHHTRYGKFLDLVIPLSISLVVGGVTMIRILALVLLFLAGYSLILTLSRGAWVGSFTGVLGVIVRLRKVLMTVTILAAVFLTAIIILPRKGEIYRRFMSLVHLEESAKKERSLTHRRDFYKTAMVLIKERPFVGWGYGRKTPRVILKRMGEEWFASRGLRPFKSHAHNTYLEVTLETGLLGLLTFLTLLGVCLLNYLKVKPGDGEVFFTKTGAFFSILALMVHGLVTNFFQQPFIFLLFLYIALVNAEVKPGAEP